MIRISFFSLFPARSASAAAASLLHPYKKFAIRGGLILFLTAFQQSSERTSMYVVLTFVTDHHKDLFSRVMLLLLCSTSPKTRKIIRINWILKILDGLLIRVISMMEFQGNLTINQSIFETLPISTYKNNFESGRNLLIEICSSGYCLLSLTDCLTNYQSM